jgi:hypothetical protein
MSGASAASAGRMMSSDAVSASVSGEPSSLRPMSKSVR